jgi:hypothetical protein
MLDKPHISRTGNASVRHGQPIDAPGSTPNPGLMGFLFGFVLAATFLVGCGQQESPTKGLCPHGCVVGR